MNISRTYLHLFFASAVSLGGCNAADFNNSNKSSKAGGSDVVPRRLLKPGKGDKTTKKSSQPSSVPSSTPSSTPSSKPSMMPSETPSLTPSSKPSMMPSETPSLMPSSKPSYSMMPSSKPSSQPSVIPSMMPSKTPSSMPSVCGEAVQFRFRPVTFPFTETCALTVDELYMFEDASCTGTRLIGASYSASGINPPTPYTTYDPENAFDDDPTTFFFSSLQGCSSTDHWLAVEFEEPTTVRCVRLIQEGGIIQTVSTLIVESRDDSSSAWAPVDDMAPATFAGMDNTIELCKLEV